MKRGDACTLGIYPKSHLPHQPTLDFDLCLPYDYIRVVQLPVAAWNASNPTNKKER